MRSPRMYASECFQRVLVSDAQAVVLICEGRTFIAGADITEFGGPVKASLSQIQTAMENLAKPIIARWR